MYLLSNIKKEIARILGERGYMGVGNLETSLFKYGFAMRVNPDKFLNIFLVEEYDRDDDIELGAAKSFIFESIYQEELFVQFFNNPTNVLELVRKSRLSIDRWSQMSLAERVYDITFWFDQDILFDHSKGKQIYKIKDLHKALIIGDLKNV